ncbi:hypothetical protein B0T09DRAFT_100899 [Sordaria sp. MPI-SDFR-AT-0083]|nr:hypothetical protein B0T09DRAFT_100899 [Sordaria sp. MPI-SDFR-AT-0083]
MLLPSYTLSKSLPVFVSSFQVSERHLVQLISCHFACQLSSHVFKVVICQLSNKQHRRSKQQHLFSTSDNISFPKTNLVGFICAELNSFFLCACAHHCLDRLVTFKRKAIARLVIRPLTTCDYCTSTNKKSKAPPRSLHCLIHPRTIVNSRSPQSIIDNRATVLLLLSRPLPNNNTTTTWQSKPESIPRIDHTHLCCDTACNYTTTDGPRLSIPDMTLRLSP